MEKPQVNISNVVEVYKQLCPDEYQAVIGQIKDNADNQLKDTGAIKGTDFIERVLFEIPETLNDMLENQLDDEDREYFRSKNGSRWFAKKFKEFSLVTV